jgi:hypothetical protein
MVYTPKMSVMASATIKSFALALGLPQTKALEKAVSLLPLLVHPVLVCQKCRKRGRCGQCFFHAPTMPADVKKIMDGK